MNIDPFLWPTLLLAVLIFYVGRHWRPRRRRVAFVLAVIAALPGLFHIVYYLHVLDNAALYYEYRSWPGTELLAAGMGLLAGMIARALAHSGAMPRRGASLLLLVLLLIAIVVPYAKMLLLPVNLGKVRARSREGVVQQSLPSSCGPAAAATVAGVLGVSLSERELIHDAYTTRSGTEVWYLARALRRHGLTVRFLIAPPDSATIPTPAVLGVHFGDGGGHFVAAMEETPDAYTIGDPNGGRRSTVQKSSFPGDLALTGFVMAVSRGG